MRFLRAATGCWRIDRPTNNHEIRELEIYNVLDKVEDNKRKWAEHLNRMKNGRLPLQVTNYKPEGRSLGQPRRWVL